MDANANTWLRTYDIPKWLPKDLSIVPSTRVELAHLGTPIQPWRLPGIPNDVELYIKRDDMTGVDIGGNKIRRLEFVLADALTKGCRHVITTGVLQSNHCQVTAMSCARLGLQCHLFLKSDHAVPDCEGVSDNSRGNLMLNNLSGANVYLLPKGTAEERVTNPCMEKLATQLKNDDGETAYIIPLGGSSILGVFGYIEAFKEMIGQGIQERFSDIVMAVGSGGTLEGVAIANYLTGNKLRVHAFIACFSTDYFYDHMQTTLNELGLGHLVARNLARIVGGYQGQGHGTSTKEELEFISDTARTTGVVLERTYTGKTARGLVHQLHTNRSAFKGDRILFIHTGGIFSIFDGVMGTAIKNENVTIWPL